MQRSEQYNIVRKWLRYIAILLLLVFIKRRIYDRMKPITTVLDEMHKQSYRKVILGNSLVVSIYGNQSKEAAVTASANSWLPGILRLVWNGNYNLASMYPKSPSQMFKEARECGVDQVQGLIPTEGAIF